MEDFFMWFSMPNVDPLTQVLLTKPAEVVQEACQVLEKHGRSVKKELKSELYYSSTLCQVVFQVLHYANLIVALAPTAQTDLQMCTHTHTCTYLSHPTPNTHICIYPTPPPNTHACTYPTPPPTHTHVLIPPHPPTHMYLSHPIPNIHTCTYPTPPPNTHTYTYPTPPPNIHTCMYLSHPTPQHTHMYLSHPTPNTHTCTYPTPPPTHTHVLIPPHPQHTHMYLSHPTPQHTHMYLSHPPPPTHTCTYPTHPQHTHMYLSHPPPTAEECSELARMWMWGWKNHLAQILLSFLRSGHWAPYHCQLPSSSLC